jgi:hypothetical protein
MLTSLRDKRLRLRLRQRLLNNGLTELTGPSQRKMRGVTKTRERFGP